MKKKKVLVGMSGGVDSSVTAFLLKQSGYEVEGLSFILWEARSRGDFSTCCSLQAVRDAAGVAGQIGIRHDSLDVRNAFIERVIEPFVEAYTQGRTPNPCILCNQHIKFPLLLREVDARGIEYIATGHYARVAADQKLYASGAAGADHAPVMRRSVLLRGAAEMKDQSYFLYVLSQEQLGRLVLPLGHFSKDEVRRMASAHGLAVAGKPESQEICFIEDKNYFKFIGKLSPVANAEGPIIDAGGRVVGTHHGIFAYTIGQRKGLGIAAGEPLFVTRIDPVRNAVHVGPREQASRRDLEVRELNWLVPSIDPAFSAAVKVRSTMKGEPARISVGPVGAAVSFESPQWAPAPGQSAVFYLGDVVAGGGIIQ